MDKNSHSPLQVIYVPGLGDKKVGKQRRAFDLWKIYGVSPSLFHMDWSDGEPFEPKFERLLAEIDQAAKNGSVALVGASAGGAVVVEAYAERQETIKAVACICGKIARPEYVNPRLYEINPAFYGCMQALPAAHDKLDRADRARILSSFAIADEAVHRPDSRLPGSARQLMPSVGHLLSIAYGLTLGSWRIARFLKRTAPRK
jgi:pimeloyl-ACP methyl ester carboxylesterase